MMHALFPWGGIVRVPTGARMEENHERNRRAIIPCHRRFPQRSCESLREFRGGSLPKARPKSNVGLGRYCCRSRSRARYGRYSSLYLRRGPPKMRGARPKPEIKMMSVFDEAVEWLDRAEQAREVAGQLTDPGARKAVFELADTFDRLARAAATPAVLRRRELALRQVRSGTITSFSFGDKKCGRTLGRLSLTHGLLIKINPRIPPIALCALS